MLAAPARRIADRLVTALMTLAHASVHIGETGGTPTLSAFAAHNLFFRLAWLVTRLAKISILGVPPRRIRQPKPAPSPAAPAAPRRRSTLRVGLARLIGRPGWLLAAMPDLAPATAADLRPLLADPAAATLLQAIPHLHRVLRPLLRALDLSDVPPPDTPSPTPALPRPDPAPPHHLPPPGERPTPSRSAPPTPLIGALAV